MQRPSPLAGLRRLIEILIEGYGTLNRRLWILVVPIGLDLFLWLGPRISSSRLAEYLRTVVQGMSARDAGWTEQVLSVLKEWGNEANLATLVSAFVLPLLLPRLGNPLVPGYARTAWAPPAGVAAVPVPLLALVLGLLFWSFYLVPLADLVRETGEGGRALLRRVVRTWGRMIRFAGLVLFSALLLLLPAGFVTTVGSTVSPTLANLILLLGIGFFLWVVLYLYFAPTAILFSGVGPLRAVYYSIRVVRSSFWQSVGFILLSALVHLGTVVLWQRLAFRPLGVLLGLLANAYITGGLAAAGLIFYRERLRAWLATRTRPPTPANG